MLQDFLKFVRNQRQKIAMTGRYLRLRLAGWLVRPLQCTTVSSELVLQAAKKMAELDSYVEKSGEIQHRKHVYAQLTGRLREVGQMLEGAVRIGDPSMSSEQLVQVYMNARWLSMSANQRKKIQRAQAAQEIAKNLQPKPPVATAVTA